MIQHVIPVTKEYSMWFLSNGVNIVVKIFTETKERKRWFVHLIKTHDGISPSPSTQVTSPWMSCKYVPVMTIFKIKISSKTVLVREPTVRLRVELSYSSDLKTTSALACKSIRDWATPVKYIPINQNASNKQTTKAWQGKFIVARVHIPLIAT